MVCMFILILIFYIINLSLFHINYLPIHNLWIIIIFFMIFNLILLFLNL